MTLTSLVAKISAEMAGTRAGLRRVSFDTTQAWLKHGGTAGPAWGAAPSMAAWRWPRSVAVPPPRCGVRESSPAPGPGRQRPADGASQRVAAGRLPELKPQGRGAAGSYTIANATTFDAASFSRKPSAR